MLSAVLRGFRKQWNVVYFHDYKRETKSGGLILHVEATGSILSQIKGESAAFSSTHKLAVLMSNLGKEENNSYLLSTYSVPGIMPGDVFPSLAIIKRYLKLWQ